MSDVKKKIEIRWPIKEMTEFWVSHLIVDGKVEVSGEKILLATERTPKVLICP